MKEVEMPMFQRQVDQLGDIRLGKMLGFVPGKPDLMINLMIDEGVRCNSLLFRTSVTEMIDGYKGVTGRFFTVQSVPQDLEERGLIFSRPRRFAGIQFPPETRFVDEQVMRELARLRVWQRHPELVRIEHTPRLDALKHGEVKFMLPMPMQGAEATDPVWFKFARVETF